MSSNQIQLKDVPDILYKYRYFDERDFHLSILAEQKLWFTSPQNFNDPFDSILEFQLVDDPPGIMDQWANDLVGRLHPDWSGSARSRLAKERLVDIRSTADYADWFHKYSVLDTYNKFGICALSSKHNNLLMWAHYSANHTGFCVGLDKSVIIAAQNALAEEHHMLLDMVKIDYREEMPRINFFNSMLSRNNTDDIVTLLSTKSIHWKYEDEYRLTLWEQIDKPVKFWKELVKIVYLGCRISDENRRRILTILDENEVDAQVYSSVPSDQKFELIFNQIR